MKDDVALGHCKKQGIDAVEVLWGYDRDSKKTVLVAEFLGDPPLVSHFNVGGFQVEFQLVHSRPKLDFFSKVLTTPADPDGDICPLVGTFFQELLETTVFRTSPSRGGGATWSQSRPGVYAI
jgi:hypothetical protein